MRAGGGIPADAWLDPRRKVDDLAPLSPGRRATIEGAAHRFGVPRARLHRALAGPRRPRGVRRADRGAPRTTQRAALEHFGIETAGGLVEAPKGLLNRATVNRDLRLWGSDPAPMTRAPPPST